MHEITNEMLTAYADNELSAVDRLRVEAHMAAHPEAAAFVGEIRAMRDAMVRAIKGAEIGPTPNRLLDAIMNAPMGKIAPKSAVIVPLRAQARWSTIGGYALAATSAGIAALAAAWLWEGGFAPPRSPIALGRGGLLVANAELKQSLDSTASGPKNGSAAPIEIEMTFANKAGEFCRQFTTAAPGHSSAGVACRQSDRSWRIEAVVPVTRHASGATGGFRPAGRDARPELDAIVDKIIAGDPLDPNDESELIRSDWKPNRRR